MNPKVKSLYDALVADGDFVGTEKDFNDFFFASGDQGYYNRRDVYNLFAKAGADVGKNYEEFKDRIGWDAPHPKPAPNKTPRVEQAKPQDPLHNLPEQKGRKPAQVQTQRTQQAQNMPSMWPESAKYVPGTGIPMPTEKQVETTSNAPAPSVAAMLENVRRVSSDTKGMLEEKVGQVKRLTETSTREGRKNRDALRMQARLHGVGNQTFGAPEGLYGITPPAPQNSEQTQNKQQSLPSVWPDSDKRKQGIGVLKPEEVKAATAPEFSAATMLEDARRKNNEAGVNTTISPKLYGVKFDDKGKPHAQWVLPDGRLTTDRIEADQAEFEARKNRRIVEESKVERKLERANAELEQMKAKLADAEKREAENSVWHKAFNAREGGLPGMASEFKTATEKENKEVDAWKAAIRKKEEQISILKDEADRRKGIDVGFWRGFGNTVSDVRTWDFGISDMTDALTFLNADYYKHGTKEEQAAGQAMMKAAFERQQTEGEYADNASWWNRAGSMTGYMPSFMIDFALTGGGASSIKLFTKGASKAATKWFGRSIIEKIATAQSLKSFLRNEGFKGISKGFGEWTVKTLGTTLDDLLLRAPIMTNTVQAAKTGADIINRKLGDVKVDENGNYSFENDKSWGSAVWQAEANSIIENASEMSGERIGKQFGAISRAFEKHFTATTVGKMLTRAKSSDLGRIASIMNKRFEHLGISGTVEEGIEEYNGQLWRTMLNLDDAYKFNKDTGGRENLFFDNQFHGDIWGGMVLSMGLMHAVKMGASGATYAYFKHRINKADQRGAAVMPGSWNGIRDIIDNVTNDDIGKLAASIVNDPRMTKAEKEAALNYFEASVAMRGNNFAELINSRGGDGSNEQLTVTSAFLAGYNNAVDKHAQARLQSAEARLLAQLYGLEDNELAQYIDFIDKHPTVAIQQSKDPEFAKVLVEYIVAKQYCYGMQQRAQDEQDAREAEAEAVDQSHENGRQTYERHAAGEADATEEVQQIGERLDVARQMCEDLFGDDAKYWMDRVEADPFDVAMEPTLNEEKRRAVLRYASALAAQRGVEAGVTEDKAAKRAEVERNVLSRTHKDQGMIIPAIMKTDDRQVFIVKGEIVMFPDGTAVDINNSSESLVIWDPQAGEYQFVSPEDILRLEPAIDPQTEIDAAAVQVEAEVDDYLPPPSLDNLTEEDYAKMFDDIWKPWPGSEAQSENTQAQPAPAENAQSELETTQPEESTPAPAENAQPEAAPQEQPAPTPEASLVSSEPAAPEQPQAQEQPATAMSRIPVDESGKPVFEKATPEEAWNALVEKAQGNKDAARIVAAKQAEQAQAEAERLQKENPTTTEAELSGDPMAMIDQMNANNAANERAQAEHQAKLAEAQRKAEFWAQVGKVEGDRAAMEAERQRAEREAEEQRIKAAQDAERQRAEREAEEQRAKAQEEERQREAEVREYLKIFSDEELLEHIERYENQIAEIKRDNPWDTPGIRDRELYIRDSRTELERRAKERAQAEQEEAARAQESDQATAEAKKTAEKVPDGKATPELLQRIKELSAEMEAVKSTAPEDVEVPEGTVDHNVVARGILKQRELAIKDKLIAETEHLSDQEVKALSRKKEYGIMKDVLSEREWRYARAREAEQKRSEFEREYNQLTPLPNSKKKPKAFSMHEAVSTDPYRPMLTGVHHSPAGEAVASDTHILVVSKDDFNPDLEGKLVDKNGNEVTRKIVEGKGKDKVVTEKKVEGKFPAYERVIPKGKPVATAPLTDQVVQDACGVAVKKEAQASVVVNFGNGRFTKMDLHLWQKFLRAAKHIGATEIEFRDSNTALVARSEKGTALIMHTTVSPDNMYKQDLTGKGRTGGAQFSMGSKSSFEERQRKAVADNGTVTPGLADMEFKVVEVDRHDFVGSASDVIKQAKKWAMENIRGVYDSITGNGPQFKFMINRESIGKYMDSSSWKNSANLGVHVAVLQKLPEVIAKSVLVETHPDRNRDAEGKGRSTDSINENGLIHRLYGAVLMTEPDGSVKTYRVKTTLRENNNSEKLPNAHNYEVTEIELIEASRADAQESNHASMTMTSNSSITGAKLLNGVEKSYDPGKKLLEESEKSSAQFRVDEAREQGDHTELAHKAVMECLRRGGIEVETVTREQAMAKAEQEGVNMLENANGTVYGWTEDGRIYLSEDGLDAETPVHEYTHLWVAAMQKNSPKAWKNIVSLLKGTEMWNVVVRDPMYDNLRGDENAIASEVLSRIGGAEGRRRFEEEAQRVLDNANTTTERARITAMIDRTRRAARSFWAWVGQNLFGIKKFKSIDEVTDRMLYDLTRGTKLDKGDKEKSLVGVHNISVDKIRRAMKMGGFANPSVAVIDVDRQLHDEFGDISLVMPSAKLNNDAQGSGGTYIGDAWTPEVPTSQYIENPQLKAKAAELFHDAPEWMGKDLLESAQRLATTGKANPFLMSFFDYLFLQQKGLEPPTIHNSTTGQIERFKTTRNAYTYIRDKGLENERNAWLNAVIGELKPYAANSVVIRDTETPYTLDNISDYMNKQIPHGDGRLHAMFMQPIENVEDLHAYEDLLTSFYPDTKEWDENWVWSMRAFAEAYKSETGDSISKLGQRAMVEIFEQDNPAEYLDECFGISLSPKVAGMLNSLAMDVRKNRPDQYFETKFERPVMFNEFAAAVVPENTPADVVDFLRSQGLQIETYEADNKASRKEAMQRATQSEGVRFRAAMSRNKAEFSEIRDKAIRETGSVIPFLTDKAVNIVSAKWHEWKGDKPIDEAIKWAKVAFKRPLHLTDSRGDKISYAISNKAIGKFLSDSATKKTGDLRVHLSILKVLPDVIENGIEAEVHPDYLKGSDDVRRVENGFNNTRLIHRFYSAVELDGKIYRVKTTFIEDSTDNTKRPHSYEVDEIEVTMEETTTTSGGAQARESNENRTLEATKLLNGVEKSYDPGKKLLDESEKSSDDVAWREDIARRVTAANPMTDDYHTGIRGADDVRTFDEVLHEAEEDGVMYPDMSLDAMKKAKEAGRITVYSSKPIEAGVFVTPSKQNAEDYAGGGKVYSKEVSIRDVAWIDQSEGQYAGEKEVTNSQPELLYREREKPAPKKTRKVYKLMRLKNGKLYPLFIDAAMPTELGVWYDADSPALDTLRGLAAGQYVIDNITEEVMTREEFDRRHPEMKSYDTAGNYPGKYPSKAAINYATDNNLRWVMIEETENAQKRFDGENRRYWNLGINGAGKDGSVSPFSMRPGWHAGSLPTMRQIGKGTKKDLRDDSFVWVEGEVSADIDYQSEAEQNPDKDMPDRIPVDGFYLKATNADSAKSQADRVGWYVAGAFKANRIISDAEARRVIDEHNARNPESPVEYDYKRESGGEFDPADYPELQESDRKHAMLAERAQAIADRLGVKIRIITDEAEVAALSGTRQRNAKGWFNTRTGEVVVVAPNHIGYEDIENTVLHEVVGHKGLRKLVGEERFAEFIDNVYKLATDATKAKIDAYMHKEFDDPVEARRIATEEYLSNLAGSIGERGFENMAAEEKTLWAKVCEAVQKLIDATLKGLGCKGVKLSDKQMSYIVYKSWSNLRDNARADAEMRAKTGYDLEVTESERSEMAASRMAPDSNLRFRVDDDVVTRDPVMARARYEARVASSQYQVKEAMLDSMLGLHDAYMAIEEASGRKRYIEDIASAENAYTAENALGSRNNEEQKLYERTMVRGITDEAAKLAKNEAELDDLRKYLMAKHGLERNP